MEKKEIVLLIGGPDMGKTNYLVRLWLALETGEFGIKSDGLPDDLEYLQAGSEMILKGEFVPRTTLEENNRIEIPIKTLDDSSTLGGKLIIPDYSGEKWIEIFKMREWSGEWDKDISDACGCLIFIRAASELIVPSFDWISATELLGITTSLSEDKDMEIPTQVMLIEWLQFLRDAFTKLNKSDKFLPRIGIIISAWDLVAEDQKEAGPDEWLEREFPMFSQYLEANSYKFDLATFGVSIVGGDLLKDPNFRKNYLNQDPHKSGFVVHTVNNKIKSSNDITIPLSWALGLNS